jgi:uncharacterized protein YqeY
MSELKKRITGDMKSAMKAKDRHALKAVRMILEAIKQKEIDERIELDDAQVMTVIQKMVKQRKDSISQFSDAGRSDLVEIEEAELETINNYMPEQLSDEEVASVVDKAINDSGANSMKDMGKLMGMLKPRLQGKADMSIVSQLNKSRLS